MTNAQKPNRRMPSTKRQAIIEAAYERQKDTGSPYKNIQIRTLGELWWIMQQRQWSGEGQLPEQMQRANFSEALFNEANLSGANLTGANLSGANLNDVNLSRAILQGANLNGATLLGANLSEANFISAEMSGADLHYADLDGATLIRAKFDSNTDLTSIILSSTTKLRDIRWNGVDLTSIKWEYLSHLGDDTEDGPFSKNDILPESKARANRQLATRLREQGINEHADRFAYQARIWQRRTTREKGLRGFFPYLGSYFLDLLAGYGYRPGRILFWYLVTITGFMIRHMKASEGWIPFGLPAPTSLPRLPWYEALILSVSSFHGRGFFQPIKSLGDPIAALASIEAVVGLFIEVSFIATFTQRFFAR